MAAPNRQTLWYTYMHCMRSFSVTESVEEGELHFDNLFDVFARNAMVFFEIQLDLMRNAHCHADRQCTLYYRLHTKPMHHRLNII